MTAIRPAIRSAIQPAIRSAFAGSYGWLPTSLFAAGEQGVWYDPSDLSTMFQDAKGTTPVTADGQTVGLIMDKSKGLALGSEILGNSGFTSWSGDNPTDWTLDFTENGTNYVSEVAGGMRFVCDNAGTATQVSQAGKLVVGSWYKIVVVLSSWTAGAVTVNGFTETGSIGTLAQPGTYTFYAPATATTAGIRRAGVTDVVIRSCSIKAIPGNHAYQTSASSRPLYKTSGGLSWLQFDGTDDFLQTAAIDFSATDETSVFAGLYKANDTFGTIAELSDSIATNDGSFLIFVNDDVRDWLVTARGTAANTVGQIAYVTQAGAATAVIAGTHDISGDSSTIRKNGVAGASGTADKGSGNFGAAYPMYIGRRGGTSVPFNGKIYSLIFRGLVSDAAQIAQAESFVAGKTGVTLP